MNFLIKNQSKRIKNDSENSFYTKIEDLNYQKFIYENNGGYFFNNSIHMFGVSRESIYHDSETINNYISKLYKNISTGLLFFAEDLFGNLFSYDTKGVVYFNIETGEKEFLCDDFISWCELLQDDLEYYTGSALIKEMSNDQVIKLGLGYRLSAKYPFVLGGDYDLNNLYLKGQFENLQYNASIANQIYNLPDGEKIKINLRGFST